MTGEERELKRQKKRLENQIAFKREQIQKDSHLLAKLLRELKELGS